jgi:ABC-type sugar transport system ATPase subunit
MTPAIETRGLTKRYRRITALSDGSVTVPEGRISALVGPNGAGKTTLLRLLAGLASPTSGEAAILGRAPRQDPAFLAEIGFLAQEIPLYRRMSADAHIGIGAHMNPRWDGQSVRDRLRGDIENLLAEHQVLVGPRKDTTAIERDHTVVQTDRTARQTTMLVRLNGPLADPEWEAEDVSLEDLVLGYMGADAAPPTAELTAAGGKS